MRHVYIIKGMKMKVFSSKKKAIQYAKNIGYTDCAYCSEAVIEMALPATMAAHFPWESTHVEIFKHAVE